MLKREAHAWAQLFPLGHLFSSLCLSNFSSVKYLCGLCSSDTSYIANTHSSIVQTGTWPPLHKISGRGLGWWLWWWTCGTLYVLILWTKSAFGLYHVTSLGPDLPGPSSLGLFSTVSVSPDKSSTGSSLLIYTVWLQSLCEKLFFFSTSIATAHSLSLCLSLSLTNRISSRHKDHHVRPNR